MEWPDGDAARGSFPSRSGTSAPERSRRSGPASTGVAVGERVVVYGPWGCGSCAAVCRAERRTCARRDTGAAQGAAWTARWPGTCSCRPPGCSSRSGISTRRRAAPLTDAALTPYHAIRGQLPRLRPGTTTVVIGVGGLGHPAIQILRRLTPTRSSPSTRGSARPRSPVDAGAHARARQHGAANPGDVIAETAEAPRSSSTSSAATGRCGWRRRCSPWAATSAPIGHRRRHPSRARRGAPARARPSAGRAGGRSRSSRRSSRSRVPAT